MTLIAQITDPHLRDDGAYPCHDPAEALRSAFARIAAMQDKPTAIVLTGDIIDRSAADYSPALALLRQSPVPLLPLSGNHDSSAAFRAAFGDWAAYQPGHLSFVQRLGGITLIGLDSNLPGGKGGVDDARLDWLAQVLADVQGPAILALHHPPFPTGAPHIDRQGFARADTFAALVADSPLRRVIAGHSHRGIQTQWAGIPASTCGAIGYGQSLSLSGRQAHDPACMTPGYELHLMRQGICVTHQVALG